MTNRAVFVSIILFCLFGGSLVLQISTLGNQIIDQSISNHQIQIQQHFDLRFFQLMVNRERNGMESFTRVNFLGNFLSNQEKDELTSHLLYLNKLTSDSSVLVIYNYGKFLEGWDQGMQTYNSQPKYYCRFNPHTCQFIQIVFPEIKQLSVTYPSKDYEPMTKKFYYSPEIPSLFLYISKYTRREVIEGNANDFYKLVIVVRNLPAKLYLVTKSTSPQPSSMSFTVLNVVCLHCISYGKYLSEIPYNTNVTLKYAWEHIHRNAEMAYLGAPPTKETTGLPHIKKPCVMRQLETNAFSCVLREIRHYFNLTSQTNLSSGLPVTLIVQAWPTESISTLQLSRALVPILEFRYPYKFAVLIDENNLSVNNMKGLYNTMDNLTWLSVGLCLTSTMLALKIIMHYSQRSNVTIIDLLLQLVGTLLQQGVTFPPRSHVKVIFGVWMLALIVISNGYSSILSVLIIKPELQQNYPTNLQSLKESSWLKLTYTKTGREYQPTTNSNLKLNLAYLLASNFSNLNSSIETKHLEDIVTNTNLVDDFHELMMISLKKNPFIFIDTNRYFTFDISMGLAKGIGKKLIPVDSILSNAIYDNFGYLVQYDYLFGGIYCILSSLSESGILHFWKNVAKESDIMFSIKKTIDRLNTNSSQDGKLLNYRMYLTTLDYFIYTPEPEALNFVLIKQVFYFYLILIAICVIVFILELGIVIIIVLQLIVSYS